MTCILHNVLYFFQNYTVTEKLLAPMEALSIALITLFVPLVFFLLEKRDFKWDKIIILSYVINPLWLLLSIIFMFVPPFFWLYEEWRFVLMGIYLFGILITINILRHSYDWLIQLDEQHLLSGLDYRNKLRQKYLAYSGQWSAKAQIWQETWAKDDLPLGSEKALIDVFIKNVNVLIEKKDENLLQNFLYNFTHTLDKRALSDGFIFKLIYSSLLSWNYQLQKANMGFSTAYGTLLIPIKNLTEYALKNKMVFYLFEVLKNHVQNKDEKYLHPFFSCFICWQFFNNITISEGTVIREDVIDHFPLYWKITPETIRDANNKIAFIWWNNFYNWIGKRVIVENPTTFDANLNYVVQKLFPTVDPYRWALLLRLKIMGLKEAIRQPVTFGTIGKTPVFYEAGAHDFEKEWSQDIKNTYLLASVLFPGLTSKSTIETLLNQLNELTLEENEKENNRTKEKYRQLLTELLQQTNPE